MKIQELKHARDTWLVGGKAAQLGALLRLGINVPDGFVITTEGTEHWDEGQVENVLRYFKALGATWVAVRSSAVAEDSSDASWAGQFDTFLFVSREQLIDKIERCIHSVNSVRSVSYEQQTNHSGKQKIAVVVQAMIPSNVSGVCFTVHPITQDPNRMVIEAAYGLGEAVVSGEVTPDNYIVSRRPRNIISRSNASQPKMLSFSEVTHETTWQDVENPDAQKLSDEQILVLATKAEEIEQHFGHPVDIEWAFYQNKLYILQSRPITTLR